LDSQGEERPSCSMNGYKNICGFKAGDESLLWECALALIVRTRSIFREALMCLDGNDKLTNSDTIPTARFKHL